MAVSTSPEYVFEGMRWPRDDVRAFAEAMEACRRRTGGYDADTMVELGKPVRSATHHLYEWDDGHAGHQYRLTQARLYLRRIRVIVHEPEGDRNVRVAVHLRRDGESDATYHPYRPMVDVLSKKALRERLLSQAKADAMRWARRYEDLEECAGIINAIRKAFK